MTNGVQQMIKFDGTNWAIMKVSYTVFLALYCLVGTGCLSIREHAYMEQYEQYKEQYLQNDKGLTLDISLPELIEFPSDSILCQVTLTNTTDEPVLIKKPTIYQNSLDANLEFLIEYPQEPRTFSNDPVLSEIIPERNNFILLNTNRQYKMSVDLK